MGQMAYYCATESKHISVINGLERGGSIAKIKQAVQPEMLDQLKKGFHCFMDNLSGDILSYDKDKQEWFSIGNIGLHYSRAEASLQGLTVGGAADTLKKKQTHQSNSSGSLKPVMIMTSDSDIKCELRKNFMSHWLFKGIYHEFIAENVNTWDPHPINITHIETVKKTYQTLADGLRGPQIAEHFNCVVTQFPIKSKHKETVKILQNFIHKCLEMVSNTGKVGSNLQEALDEQRRKKQLKLARISDVPVFKIPIYVEETKSEDSIQEQAPSQQMVRNQISSRIIGNTRERVGPIVNFQTNFKNFVDGDLMDTAEGMYTDVRKNLKPIASSMS